MQKEGKLHKAQLEKYHLKVLGFDMKMVSKSLSISSCFPIRLLTSYPGWVRLTWPSSFPSLNIPFYPSSSFSSSSFHTLRILSSSHLPLPRPKRRKPLFYTPFPSPSPAEAVNNILYNTPPSTASPITRHTLNCLVSNEPGVLSRISGTLAARGFNIDSLIVAKTEVPDLSRMTIILNGRSPVIEQARRQLEDLVPVWAVLDYTHTKVVERELLLVKCSVVKLLDF